MPFSCSMVSCSLTTSRCLWHIGTRILSRDLSSRIMINDEGYPFLIWSGVNLVRFLMSVTSCLSGQVSRGSGEIAVEITCIGCTTLRLHVKSNDSCNGGATTILIGSSRLDSLVSKSVATLSSSARDVISNNPTPPLYGNSTGSVPHLNLHMIPLRQSQVLKLKAAAGSG